MNKGVIIHLDNDVEKILTVSKNYFDQRDLGLEYIVCNNKESFEEAIEQHKFNIKALIFDLLSSDPTSEELHQKDAEFIENIHNSFSAFNIPIFVYSGYLKALEGEYENSGTVYKIDKDLGIEAVYNKIEKLYKSGFIDVFSPNGKLNELLFNDLNISFTRQFNNNAQIEAIIDSIFETKGEDSVERVQKIFQRIAIRSLMSGLLAPELDSETNKIKVDYLNTVEHYIQRISPYQFWTGDIFMKNDRSKYYLIITPRCDFASKDLDDFLVCDLIIGEFPDKTNSEGRDKIGKALNDNPLFSGYNRYIPRCPLFEGGKIELSKYRMINKKELSEDFKRIISLSDELTNEILGKFGAYFFRSGINPWDKDETIAYISKPVKE